MRLAVVGHVEWVEFVRVGRVPAQGEIAHTAESFHQAAGGGAVAAVQLARLGGGCVLYTALGEDRHGHAAKSELERLGVSVQAAWRSEPQRRAFVFLDGQGERTITTIGARLQPRAEDRLPWGELEDVDGLYLTAADPAAVRLARAARRLVCTARAMRELAAARVQIDALLASGVDAGERYERGEIDPPPALVARTAGAEGGAIEWADASTSRWQAAPLPGPVVDSYGAGDSFAAGVTYGLARGMSPQEAVALGARCGAACMTGRGPYEGQLRSADR